MILNLSFGKLSPSQLAHINRDTELDKAIELLKNKYAVNGNPTDTSDLYAVFVNIENNTDENLHQISFTIQLEIKILNEIIQHEFNRDYLISRGTKRSEYIFGVFEFPLTIVRIANVKFVDEHDRHHSSFLSNTPIILDTTSLKINNGSVDEKQLKARMLLESYLHQGFIARQLLLKSILRVLNDMDKMGYLNLYDATVSVNQLNKEYLHGIFQIDIISKIMMFTEDFIILLLSNLKNHGFYYEWLDVNKSECHGGSDIGDRIAVFLEEKENYNDQQWYEMLCYVDPNQLSVSDGNKELLKRAMSSNISEIKNILNYVQQFGSSNIDVSRRYKHAGFPIRLSYKLDGLYPSSRYPEGREFESYSIVFSGVNPLTDVLPIPYSKDVIESYTILLHALRLVIQHVVSNKLECIKRRVSGIIPVIANGLVHGFSQDEISEIDLMINEYNRNNMYWASLDLVLPMNRDYVLEKLKWYTHLDENMSKWRDNLEG